MEINLSSEVLRKWGTILIIIFAFAGGDYSLFETGVLADVFTDAPLPGDTELAKAGSVTVAAGVETFFTLDYEETPEEWLAHVCAQSTEDGCGVTESFFLASTEGKLEEKQPKTICSATYCEMVDAGSETDGVSDGEEVAYEWEVPPISGANFSVSFLADCAIFLASVRMPFHNTTEF
jgi:hypothetical protein